ncbi:DUF1127 domain-containing protein [Cognatishimia sp.]|uniref:DUF1127 domain-containing protein n=1 Tax=Cognatishimia sp. TaxID=2211648 RepID=UPI003511E925
MANAVSIAPSANPVVAYVRSAISALQDCLAKRKVYVTTLRELQTLSNRELADLGMSRASISSIAYEVAYAK